MRTIIGEVRVNIIVIRTGFRRQSWAVTVVVVVWCWIWNCLANVSVASAIRPRSVCIQTVRRIPTVQFTARRAIAQIVQEVISPRWKSFLNTV